MGGLISRILDLLFPPRCPFCNHLLDHPLGTPCPHCQNAPFWTRGEEEVVPGQFFRCCVAPGWYRDGLRTSLLQFKFHHHPEYAQVYGLVLAAAISRHLAGQYDLLTWIPVSAETLSRRGYDQAQQLAEATAAALGQQAVSLLQKAGQNRVQSSLSSYASRKENVAGMYRVPHPSLVSGRRILLIDDILTTGATLNEGANVLLAAGALEVSAAVFCRVPLQ